MAVLTNKPVKTPEDLKGLRIRTPPAPIWQESVRALGAAVIAYFDQLSAAHLVPYLPRELAFAKLKALADGAAMVRTELS